MTAERSTSVTILVVLAVIGGLLGLLAAFVAIGLREAGTAGLVGSSGLLALISGMLSLTFAYGASTLKPWAWMLGVVTEGLSLLGSGINIIGGGSIGLQAIIILISVVILYYLFQPRIKEAFGRT